MPPQTVSTYRFAQLEDPIGGDRAPADVIARALAEAEAIRERARAEGEAAGYAEGLERARTEAAQALEALTTAVSAVTATRDELTEQLSSQAGELALATAEQIISGAIRAEPGRIVDVVRGALRRLSERHSVTVLVNPDDLELLWQSVQALQAELGGIEHLDVQADRRIARAGAIAQTAYGEVDASIAAQLQSARELIEAALAGDAGLPGPAGAEDGEPVVADAV